MISSQCSRAGWHRVDDYELRIVRALQRDDGGGAVVGAPVGDGHEIGVQAGARVLGRQARVLEDVNLLGKSNAVSAEHHGHDPEVEPYICPDPDPCLMLRSQILVRILMLKAPQPCLQATVVSGPSAAVCYNAMSY